MSMPVLNSGAMTPDMARGENAQADLQARIMGLGNIGKKNIPPEVKAKKLREACEGFESIFIQRMWQEMRNTLPKEGLLHSREEHFWQDMYDQELAKKMSSAGGIGLADMMYAQLSRSLGDASRVAAGASRGLGSSNFSPEAAPLLQPQSAAKLDALNQGKDQARTPGKVEKTATGGSQDKSGSDQASARPGLRTLPSIYEGAAMQQGIVPSTAEEKQMASLPNPPGQSLPAPLSAASLAPVQEGEQELANPEIEAALAQIRAQQAMNLNSQPNAQAMTAAQAALTPGAMNVPLPEQHKPQHKSQGTSGLELERIAKRQAGDKLGAGAVRPALQPRRNNKAENSNAGNQQMAETAGASRHSRKVRYTTNIPANGRNSKKDELIRTLTTDGSGPSSKAGQGIAAYHEQMAQVREGQNPAQNLSQPVMPQQPLPQASAQAASQPVQAGMPVARQSANAAPPLVPMAANGSVPPLTANSQVPINSQANRQAMSNPALAAQASPVSQPASSSQAPAVAQASPAELSSAWAMPLAAQPEPIDNLPPQAANAWQPKASRPAPARNIAPAAQAQQAGWTPAQTAMPRPGAMQTAAPQASPAAFAPLTPLTGASLQQPEQAGRQQARQASNGIPPLTASEARI